MGEYTQGVRRAAVHALTTGVCEECTHEDAMKMVDGKTMKMRWMGSRKDGWRTDRHTQQHTPHTQQSTHRGVNETRV
jgi:hypothetical protein